MFHFIFFFSRIDDNREVIEYLYFRDCYNKTPTSFLLSFLFFSIILSSLPRVGLLFQIQDPKYDSLPVNITGTRKEKTPVKMFWLFFRSYTVSTLKINVKKIQGY